MSESECAESIVLAMRHDEFRGQWLMKVASWVVIVGRNTRVNNTRNCDSSVYFWLRWLIDGWRTRDAAVVKCRVENVGVVEAWWAKWANRMRLQLYRFRPSNVFWEWKGRAVEIQSELMELVSASPPGWKGQSRLVYDDLGRARAVAHQWWHRCKNEKMKERQWHRQCKDRMVSKDRGIIYGVTDSRWFLKI